MRPTVKLDYAFSINVQVNIVFQDGCPYDIISHFYFIFPAFPYFPLLGSKLLYVLFHLLAK